MKYFQFRQWNGRDFFTILLITLWETKGIKLEEMENFSIVKEQGLLMQYGKRELIQRQLQNRSKWEGKKDREPGQLQYIWTEC